MPFRFWGRNAAPDCSGDGAKLADQLRELIRIQRLRAVRESAVRLGMHFDEQSIGTSGDRGARHRNHLVAQSGAVTRIGDDRQMRKPVHDRNRRQVEHVAGGGIEAPDAALAQNHVLVSFGENVFGAQEKVVDRRRHSALEQDRLLHPADRLEQGIVLHVARADLDAGGDFRNQLGAFGVHCLGHDWKAGFLSRARQKLKPLLAHALKRIRRAARLERAAAERRPSRRLDDARGGENLLFRFDGARSADHDDGIAAHRDAGRDLDDRILGAPFARDLLVRLADVNDLRHAGKGFEPRRIDAPIVPDETDGGALRARHRPRLVAHLLNDTDDAIDVFRRRVVLHDD